MPARLLAYGGTSFSERRRIGQWPAIPEATLRDSYGLSANAWCFGFGVLEKQPFLIFRQRQNVENRGGYPFSLLLDPGEAVWTGFDWNPAAIADVLMQETPEVLFRTPENCSADALDKQMASLPYSHTASNGRGPLSYFLVGATLLSEPVGYAERPQALELAAALEALPVCFRGGIGWLVGGALAHGRALGSMLVFDTQATGGDSDLGRSLLSAWDSTRAHEAVRAREAQPLWNWPEPPSDFLNAVMLLRDVEAATSIDDDLLLKAETARALQPEIEQAIQTLLTRGTEPIGPKLSTRLIRQALAGQQVISPAIAGRLDSATLASELQRYGSPPKEIPKALPVPREFHLGLWTQYLKGLSSQVGQALEMAIDQLGPSPDLINAALTALPASDENLMDWQRFQSDAGTWALLEAPLRNEALRRKKRSPKPAPVKTVKQVKPDEDLLAILFESTPDTVEERCHRLSPPESRIALDDTLASHCERFGDEFTKAFYGKYAPLGCIMSFFADDSQERLLECFASSERHNLAGFAAEHVQHAINNKPSRSQYTAALGRFLQKDRKMLRQIADQLGFLPSEFEPKLRTLAKDKGRK